MKRNIAIGFGFVMAVVLPCMVQQGFSQYPEDRSVDFYHGNFTNDVRRLLSENYSAKALVQYITSNNIPISDLSVVMKSFVDDGLKTSQGISPPWFFQSIAAMGRLKLDECLPYLVEFAYRPDSPDRAGAIRAITRIGGSNALLFATSVITDTNIFTQSDRSCLYDNTIRYSMSGFLEWDVIRQPSDEDRRLALKHSHQSPLHG